MIWENIKDFFIIEKNGKDALVELLERSGFSDKIDKLIDERGMFMYSIGKGIYFIRLMANIGEEEVYIGISKKDLNLKSYDGIPVNILIFLVHPNNKEMFARYISNFFRLLNIPSIRKDILKCNSVEDVKSVFKREPI